MNGDLAARLGHLVGAFAQALGRLVKSKAEVSIGQTPAGDCWLATLTVAGSSAGSCTLAIDQKGAGRLAALVSGRALQDDDPAIPDLLQGALSEAIVALATGPEEQRLELTLAALELTSAWDPGQGGVACAIGLAGMAEPLVVAAGFEAAAGSVAGTAETLGNNRIDVILDIDLPVVVRFGHTELSIRALSRLGPGSVIDLGRSPDDPVEVLVSNRVVAHGEVVIVGGNYGVRILDVASRSERARSMEA